VDEVPRRDRARRVAPTSAICDRGLEGVVAKRERDPARRARLGEDEEPDERRFS
jgi:hypothetical protein